MELFTMFSFLFSLPSIQEHLLTSPILMFETIFLKRLGNLFQLLLKNLSGGREEHSCTTGH